MFRLQLLYLLAEEQGAPEKLLQRRQLLVGLGKVGRCPVPSYRHRRRYHRVTPPLGHARRVDLHVGDALVRLVRLVLGVVAVVGHVHHGLALTFGHFERACEGSGRGEEKVGRNN